MHFGATMWFTEYSISPSDLAIALEERGFESLWASEHSHLPVTGDLGDGDQRKVQADVMDPFLTLLAAAMSTKTLKLGTGICLVNQRDPIQTAKLVASIDQLSRGRFLFGIGNGWHEEEMRNHGTALATRHQLVHERVEAMRAIWTQDRAEYHGAFVNSRNQRVQSKRTIQVEAIAAYAGCHCGVSIANDFLQKASRVRP